MQMMRRQTLNTATQLFDLVLLVCSFAIATLPELGKIGPVSFTDFLSLRIKLQNIVVFLILLYVWHIIFKRFGLYGSKRLASRRGEAIDIVKATSVGAGVLAVGAFLLQLRMVTPIFVLAFWASSTLLTVSARMAIRTWLRRLRAHGHNLRNMLIVGSNRRAIKFAQAIDSKPELGYRIIGFADRPWAGTEELQKHNYSLVCDLETLPTFLRHTVVDEVVLALPIRSFHLNSSDLAVLCEQQGIILRLLSDLFNLKTARPRAEEMEGATLITHYVGSSGGGALLMKRVVDFMLSLIVLVLIAPVLLITAILVKLTSPGPVFFVQERIGYNKRPFYIYKFRTMVVNAEAKLRDLEHLNEVSGPVFKIKNDPRITPIGKFLRRTSIDELPQLFNVLSGDMSLVGPRPLQVRDYDLFTKDCEDWQRCRFSVRPGITCLWQINGRSAMPFEQWMELDLQYVHKWSLWLDFEILARTIPAVLKGSGAA
jgi:exopolysaccharide biosynthesis polyprenyl glycosylphosphotransferase